MSEELIKNEQTTTLEVIEVEAPKVIEVVVDESIGWTGGDAQYHHELAGRNDPDQHEIEAITGLREELDILESLRTLYSDSLGVANYYEWDGSAPEDYGYFVSLAPHSSKIKICEGSCIFGVTVNKAGFVGGQSPDVPNRKCGLVATFGQVDVRCESDVAEGDRVVSNSRGEAVKTTTGGGYTVINVNNKQGVYYATISLGIQACTVDTMGKKIQVLTKRMDNADLDIAEAMNVANQAYNKSSESGGVSEEALKKALEALAKSEETDGKVEDVYQDLVSVSTTAETARAIAEGAVSSANDIREEAKAEANDALTRVNEFTTKYEPLESWVDPETGKVSATYVVQYMDEQGLSTKAEVDVVNSKTEENASNIEKNAESISTMVSSVDKYSVGEYSQAYGLSLAQARTILKEGMVYIPTKHGDVSVHAERYTIDEETFREREFVHGYYYVWTDLGEGSMMWSEKQGEVWFSPNQAPTSDTYKYWYNNVVLFMKEGNEWVEVATLAGNVNNRIVSMVRQDVDSITAEVINARGGLASLSAKLSDTDAKVSTTAQWMKGENDSGERMYNIATIDQSADQDGSSLALVVTDTNGEGENKILNGASIVLNYNEDGSSIVLDAENILINGEATFATKDETDGKTYIEGGHIKARTITADHIATDAIKAEHIEADAIKTEHIEAGAIKADQIDAGAITADHIATDAIKAEMIDVEDLNAFGATIAGWKIGEDKLYKDSTRLITDDAITNTSLVDGTQSPIRLAIGTPKIISELEAIVTAQCVGGAFRTAVPVSELKIDGTIQSVEIIDCSTATGETFSDFSAEIEYEGDEPLISLCAVCNEGPYEGAVDVKIKLTSLVVDSSVHESNYNFQVLEDGSLYAKKAHIEGGVYTAEGKLGGLEIGASGLSFFNSKVIKYDEAAFSTAAGIPYYVCLIDGEYMFSQTIPDYDDQIVYVSNYTSRFIEVLKNVDRVVFNYSTANTENYVWKGVGVWKASDGISAATFIQFEYADAKTNGEIVLDTSQIEDEFYLCIFLSHEPIGDELEKNLTLDVGYFKTLLTENGYRGSVVPVKAKSDSVNLRALYIDEDGRLCIKE